MNQKLIKTEKATLLLLKLPEGASNPKVIKSGEYFHIDYELPKKVDGFSYSGGFALFYNDFGGKKKYPKDLIPLGFAKEVSEEVAKEIIPEVDEGLNVITYPVFNDKDVCTNKALPAFHSLLQANEVYLVNTYDEINFVNNVEVCYKTYDKWQQAKENTGNWYILKLIK